MIVEKIAVWLYSPGYSNDNNPFYCDDCVTSVDDEPCSCNLDSIIEDGKPKGIENVDFKWYDLRNHPYYKANPNKFDILPEDEKYHNYYYTLDEKKDHILVVNFLIVKMDLINKFRIDV